MEDFRKNLSSFEQPADFIIVMIYCMSMYAPIRICIEAGVFRHLAASSKPVTAKELASNITTDPDDGGEREEFIIRMLRAVCALNLVDETEEPFTYVANELTTTLADPGFEAGFLHLFTNTIGPHSTLSHMMYWARDHGYKAPTSSDDGPLQQALGIQGTTSFQYWAKDDPSSLSLLSAFMKRIQPDRLNWSAWFPADVLFPSSGADKGGDHVFMVDVGGGLGHDLSGFASRYPDRKMRLAVEDLPEVIKETRTQDLDPRIELLEHDFFQPQPIQGASIYFMHKIMHDWPDAECITILTQLRRAMSPESRIFINDVILPDKGTPLLFAAFDMTMFAELSAKERSETMWKNMISQVDGLAVRKFWQAPGLKGEGIVEVEMTS